MKIMSLVGKTLTSITRRTVTSEDSERYDLEYDHLPIYLSVGEDLIVFECTDGEVWLMTYEPDCCASVRIEDICGDLDDLIGSPILIDDLETSRSDDDDNGSFTWSFYKLSTVKGHVTIRWYGSSKGYYSETVTFARATAN